MTTLVRGNFDLETDGVAEQFEAIVEGTEAGPDIHLQMISQITSASGRDLALDFDTTDGDTYGITLAFTSGKVDVNGNGPAHILVGLKGTRSTSKVALNVMGGNADITSGSLSNDVLGLPFSASQTPDQFAAGNQFCLNTSTGATTTGCPTVAAPNTLVVSGLTAWTMTGIYAVRQGTANVSALSTY
jgi:hypothetical protein